MPEDNSQALAEIKPKALSEIRVTTSSNPVMDTAAFEHLMRVSRLMAEGGMMHKTLITYPGQDEKGNKVELFHPPQVILARAFMIAEQAARWGQSPFAVMQCASFVHGRLLFEGKFVHAMLTDQFGIQLRYDFGLYDPKTETVDITKPGQNDLLGVIVSGEIGGRTESLHGSVGMWKTSGNNSPWRPGTYTRQLRYRGAREWSRAFAPGAILGIVTDDEQIEAPINLTPPRAKLSERIAKTPAGSEGFNADHVETTIAAATGQEQAAEAEVEETAPEAGNDENASEAAPDAPETSDEAADGQDATEAAQSETGEAQTEGEGQAEENPILDKIMFEVEMAVDWPTLEKRLLTVLRSKDFTALGEDDQRRLYMRIMALGVWDLADKGSVVYGKIAGGM